jgi:hypothetical protein
LATENAALFGATKAPFCCHCLVKTELLTAQLAFAGGTGGTGVFCAKAAVDKAYEIIASAMERVMLGYAMLKPPKFYLQGFIL